MEINEPINLDDELLFCEDCNARALTLLESVRYAVKFAGIEPSSELQRRVEVALSDLLVNREACADCNED